MIFPNISALKKLINNYFPGAPNTTQDYLQLIEQSSGRVVGWVDERGLPQGSLALPPISEDADAASIWLEDDFVTSSGITGLSVSSTLLPQFVGQLNWLANVGNAGITTGSVDLASSAPPNMGSAVLATNSTSGQGVTLSFCDTSQTFNQVLGFPLTLNTGWEANFVFKFPLTTSNSSGNTTPFAQKRLYIGFAFAGNSPGQAINPYFNYGRPSKFIGLRYDTDPGNPEYTLGHVANAAFGQTVYSSYSGDPSTAPGATFAVAGYANPDNNGTFLCVGASGGALTLNNPNGVAVSASGTATLITPAISDTTYHFECVQNPIPNSNAQGTSGGVLNAGIAPDYNWHRFRMRSIVQGQILFSIDGGTETMISMGMDSVQGSSLEIETSAPPAQTPGYTFFGGPFGSGAGVSGSLLGGTNVLVSGSNYPTNNGSWLLMEPGSQARGNSWSAYSASLLTGSGSGHPSGVTTETGNANLTFSWYNSFSPVIIYGNDTQASPYPGFSFYVDYFSFVYSPRLALDFNGTANPTLPRYFPGQV